MDFSGYPNISAAVAGFGKVKETAFNKKAYALAEQSWASLSPQEMTVLEQQIPYGVKIQKTCIVTPVAIVVYITKTVRVIPVRNVMWIYGNVVKQTTNFIPTAKYHTLYLLDRTGEITALCQVTTNGFSKKNPTGEAMEQIHGIIGQYRTGVIYGYSEDVENYFRNNFDAAIQAIDIKCANGQQ